LGRPNICPPAAPLPDVDGSNFANGQLSFAAPNTDCGLGPPRNATGDLFPNKFPTPAVESCDATFDVLVAVVDASVIGLRTVIGCAIELGFGVGGVLEGVSVSCLGAVALSVPFGICGPLRCACGALE